MLKNCKSTRNCSAGLRIYIANKVRFADREKEQWKQAQIHLHNELVRIAIFVWICACNYEGTEQLRLRAFCGKIVMYE